MPGGRLQALGIAWDSRPKERGGQRWLHLYPDQRRPEGVYAQRRARSGGWGGIRTHEPLRVGGFQDRCLKPLGHPSKLLISLYFFGDAVVANHRMCPYLCPAVAISH